MSNSIVLRSNTQEPVKPKRQPRVVEEPVKPIFNPLANLDDTLDSIEKAYALTGSSMLPGEKRQTTGLLGLNLVLSGGIVPGWYTTFGPEQSCKSTLTMWFMIACLDSGIPVKAIFDYEGCLVGSSRLTTPKGDVDLKDFFEGRDLEEDTWIDTSKEGLTTLTVGGLFAKISGIKLKGVRPITKIRTQEGKSLSGYKHPILALSADGDLVWRFLEDLKEGEQVVTEV